MYACMYVYGRIGLVNFLFQPQVIGEAHDKTDVVHVETFETVYALMEHLSPSFTTQFAGRLSSKLEHLKSSSKEDNEN